MKVIGWKEAYREGKMTTKHEAAVVKKAIRRYFKTGGHGKKRLEENPEAMCPASPAST